MVLTAGREVPGRGVVQLRGEGVAIVLSGPALSAWKAGGSQWKAWNSRLVTAKVKVGSGRSSHLHILSCYAPTFAASRDEKDRFFDSLQDALSSIPSDECFVMLGDFNARVGSRGVFDERWYERGPHGCGELNEAGKELLSFLSTNEATVCNTWFKKRDICKQTWQHPKSKRWHCIDYMIVRKARCLDVSVMRGADCNTDHRLLRAKLTVGRSRSFRRDCAGASVRRWDVARLQGSSVDAKGRETTRGRYLKRIEEKLLDSWDKDSSVETKWDTLKSVLCGGAEAELGYEDRRQPDGLEIVRLIFNPYLRRETGCMLYGLALERREIERNMECTQGSETGSESGQGHLVSAQSKRGREGSAWWEVGMALH